MKKFLFVLIGLIVAGNAFGSVSSCKVEPCSGRGNDCLASGTLTKDPGAKGEKWTYVCEKKHCETGDVVCSGDLEKCFACYIAGQAGVNFLWAGDDRWQKVEKCDNDILKKDDHAHKVLWDGTHQQLVFGGDVGEKVISASNFRVCIKHVCDENYREKDGRCVENKQTATVNNSGGKDGGTSSCVTPWGKIDVGQSLQQKHTKQECRDNKIFVTDNKGTEFEVACRDGADLVCKPSQCPKNYTVDDKNGKCVPVNKSGGGNGDKPNKDAPAGKPNSTPVEEPEISSEQKACEKKSDVADWTNGVCVCKQSDYEWNGIDCIKGAGLELKELYEDIDSIVGNYKKSKWKDEEGNFNTARLASDSIAGVVLGTVGSVVTSTVIKKNQVEDGFEDLKCSIGGQSVATWGDEFQVGLQ